jgi:hypothetical protein
MTTDRAEYVAGLRQLADLLEQHDELPLPHDGSATKLLLSFLGDDDPKSALVAAARVIPGKLDKNVWGNYFDLDATLGGPQGLKIKLCAFRDDVCERVVVGTETVTKRVPDPNVTVPMVDVTETVEHVRWDCKPLLSGGAS